MNLIMVCLLCGVISLVFGAVWYHPKVFGTAWMSTVDLTEEDAKKGNMPMIFGITFLISVYFAYEMKWINHDDELPAFIHGMYHGFTQFAVFAAGAIIINGLFEQKSGKYLLINAGYWLVLLTLIGGVIAAVPFKKAEAEEENTEEEEKTTDENSDTGMLFEFYDTNSFQKTKARQSDTYYLG